MAKLKTTPVWREYKLPRFPRLATSGKVDAVVVGGGITGLTAAYFLKQAGKRVYVLERDRLACGDTSHTTAHLTCVTDVRLRQLAKTFGREQAALTWYAGINAIDTIERVVHEHGIACKFRRVPGFLHAAIGGERDESDELRAETELARELGFDVQFVDRTPVMNKPGMLIRNQAKFQPLEYVAALAALVNADGSRVYEHSEVTDVEDDPLVVVANGARIECEHLVIATHVPIMGKTGLLSASLLQTKLAPMSSYVVSGRVARGTLPEASFWDTNDPYYYLRVDAEEQFDRVIFGGNDHKTGQVEATDECFRRLEQTLHEILPQTVVDHRWSGQVISTNDGLPLIGEVADRQFVATGFNGNGITFATAAGMIITDGILKKDNPWQDLFAVDRRKFRGGTWEYIKQNLDYPYYLLADRLRTPEPLAPEDVGPECGAVIKLDGQRVACSRDARGNLHTVSAICTHLGCVVHWNQAEQTWDCPCHGSRFSPDGKVLAGPAETPLEEVKAHAAAQ